MTERKPTLPYRDAARPVAERVADLLARMSFEEKQAQLGGVWATALLDENRFSETVARDVLRHGTGHVSRIGSSTVLRPCDSARLANDIQRFLLDNTRLGIPAIIHEESCAGFTSCGATQFPQAIGLAATWEPVLVEEMCAVIRRQMRAVGARQTLAPVLDVARDPRWGRCEETFGEDPYLIARFGVAYVRGVQGTDLRDGVAATGKHFIGYGAPEGGLNWAPAQVPRRELRERFLPPFAAAIREGGLASMMNGYEEIDGVPCGASKDLFDGLLRGELGFGGTVVSDYYTVPCLMDYHRVAADKSEAAARALEAGIDVELPQLDCYGVPLAEAIESGRISAALVDRAVERLLRMKFELGLFEAPFVDAEAATAVFDTAPQRALARRIAQQSIVLLKNDGDLLPLSPSLSSVTVVGPNADSARNLQGDYHFPTHLEILYGDVREAGVAPRPEQVAAVESTSGSKAPGIDLSASFPPTVTVLEGIRKAVSGGTEIRAARGCEVGNPSTAGFAAAVAAARGADVAIVVVGDRSGLVPGCTSGEGIDRADISLPGAQSELVKAVAATGTPTVVVLINGRPPALGNIAGEVPAIVEAWLPGEEGGHAVADVLFGRATPGGKLPVTLPRVTGQVPLYYNHKPSGARNMFHGQYADQPTSPLFPFGHGLSYTRFAYSGLELSSRKPAPTETLKVSADVTNAGGRTGEEVVQLYVCDRVAGVTRPVTELKGFKRIALGPAETRTMVFHLDLRQLAFYDMNMDHVVEPGEVEIMIGSSSEDIRLRATIVTEGARCVVRPGDVRPTKVEVR